MLNRVERRAVYHSVGLMQGPAQPALSFSVHGSLMSLFMKAAGQRLAPNELQNIVGLLLHDLTGETCTLRSFEGETRSV